MINGVWNSPGILGKGAFLRELTRDWQLSGVLRRPRDRPTPSVTLPEQWRQREHNRFTGLGRPGDLGSDLGSGCSDNQYAQFKATAVKGRATTAWQWSQAGNYMRAARTRRSTCRCAEVRSAKYSRNPPARVTAGRLQRSNAVVINARSTSATFNNPTSMTLTNNQYMADGA